jgi:HK97 family phage major capsid protein
MEGTEKEILARIAELREKAEAVHASAKAISDQYPEGDVPKEQAAKIDVMLSEAEEHLSKAVRLERELRLSKSLEVPIVHFPAPATGTGVKYEGRIEVGRDRGEDQTFGSFGEQLKAIHAVGTGVHRDVRLKASGLSEGVPSDGGFLVQTDFVETLMKRTHETGVLTSRCQQIPISSKANRVKINAVAETSRANGSRWGGIRGYWGDEANELKDSRPKFRQIEVSLNKLIGLCFATDELLEDVTALEAVISQGFAEEFGFKLDDAIINGDGSGKPLGILNSGALVSVAKESGQSAQTVVAKNIIKMRARLLAACRPNSIWVINQDIEPDLHTMNLPVGTGGVPVYLPANGLSGQPFDTLYGRPITPIEQCQTLGTLGDIMLLDLSQYLLGTKSGIKSDVSIHVRFIYDESVFRFVMRVDGQPAWNSPLTPYKGTNTLSPFVALATRS